MVPDGLLTSAKALRLLEALAEAPALILADQIDSIANQVLSGSGQQKILDDLYTFGISQVIAQTISNTSGWDLLTMIRSFKRFPACFGATTAATSRPVSFGYGRFSNARLPATFQSTIVYVVRKE
jgi:hypothetical protein